MRKVGIMVDRLLEIKTDRKSEILQAYRYPLCDEYYRRDWGKHDFSCGYIFL